MWEELGIKPDVVLGNGIGEYAAACISGALSLPAAAALVAMRGRLLANGVPIDAVMREFHAFASTVAGQAPHLPFISGATGRQVDTAPDAGHWTQQIAAPIRLQQALEQLAMHHRPAFGLTIGSTSTSGLPALYEKAAPGIRWLATTRDDQSGHVAFLEGVAQLYSAAYTMNLAPLYSHCTSGCRLPPYCFTPSFWSVDPLPAS
jgi:acyl transferase domain-containing protein